ncbi:MAG: flippase activity-associated protein Agl23 [Phycisphaerales bacterium]
MKWLDRVSCDKRLRLSWFLIFVVALGAFSLRAPRLCMRPMHTDEAVHAHKFGRCLLEQGVYVYDPQEYHGPTLNYFTLIPAWLGCERTYAEVTEVTLRIVPVVFGTGLILLIAGLAGGLGLAAVAAAVLAALSPAMVFYSRYYIQEMLLACFTLGVIVCGYRYARTRSLVWALAAGGFAGLMHATKETAVIAFGSMVLALALVILTQSGRDRSIPRILAGINWLHVLFGIAAAVVVSALLFSVFLRRPVGILDSYRTYATYFGRAGGQDTTHVHPWYYYLQILSYARYAHGPIWTEGWIVLLAVVGLAPAVRGTQIGRIDPKLVRFLAIYTLAMTIVYSAIPYKTPWCLLSFLTGLILLAGVGAVALWTWARKPVQRGLLAALAVVAVGHLGFLSYRANFVFYADSRNPYVYAHPTEEIFTAVDAVREYAATTGAGRSKDKPVLVAAPGMDYWPLPWYFRDLPCVGYVSGIPSEVGPLVLVSDKLEGALQNKIYEETPREQRRMYMYLFDPPCYIWFRPGVKLVGFVRKDLWDENAATQSDAAALIEASHERQTPATPNAVRP